MITQNLTLNLIPNGVLPRLNVSQYDKGQTVAVTLNNGSVPFSLPSGATVYVSGTKADNTGFEYACSTSGGLSFTIKDQMTVFAGEVTCELSIYQGNNRLSTINFILNVEKAALSEDTEISQTDIPIIENIPQYVTQAANSANLAHQWATGGGSDTPSATNNAKYWAQQAAQTDIGRATTVDYSNDQSPYQFRRCAHNAVYDKLVGISYVKNQLVQNGNFASTSGWATFASEVSASGNVATVEVSSSAQNGSIYQNIQGIGGHKYLVMADIKSDGTHTASLRADGYGGNFQEDTTSASFARLSKIISLSSDATIRVIATGYAASMTFQVKNFMCIDLTLMFGTSIADKIYTMEQATAGSGLAWIRQYGFLNGTYEAFNVGTIESAKPKWRKVVGFNQLDLSKVTLGKMVDNRGGLNNSNKRSVSDYIKVFPSTQYYLKGVAGEGVYLSTAMFDENKNFISNVNVYGGESASGKITTPSNAWYMRVNLYTADIDTAIVNLSDDAKNGTYEPYKEVTYPLGGDTLRGVPKLVGDDLVADGDVKTSDGVKNERYDLADLGSLNWTYSSSLGAMYAMIPCKLTTSSYVAKGLCSRYLRVNEFTNMPDKTFLLGSAAVSSSQGSIIVKDSDYTDAATFKTAMSGVYLVYEKATPTTSVSTPFTSPQVSLSTEETDTPCGHDSVVVDIPEWMQTEYFDDVRADASKVQGVERNLGEIECDKTVEGTYTLSCTVDSSGNKTYSWA